LHKLSSRLIMLQDDERRRLARELHDGLGQELSTAKLLADQLARQNAAGGTAKQKAEEISELVNSAIQQVRSISHLLHPPLLDEVGLQFALRSYLDGLTKRSGVETSIEISPEDFPRFSPELETAIFRIIQEALTNVYRHSGARKAYVTLQKNGDQIAGAVRDDGKGISREIEELQADRIGIGLAGMIQRVREFGGEIRLRNLSPGTSVEVTIPVEADARRDQAVPVAGG
jgi:two-component system, NarL family, sensor kinase